MDGSKTLFPSQLFAFGIIRKIIALVIFFIVTKENTGNKSCVQQHLKNFIIFSLKIPYFDY